MLKLAANAQYFEDRAPWAAAVQEAGRASRRWPRPCETVIETGDFHVSTVGDNLPNENEIREKYGSKSFLFTGSSRTLAPGHGLRRARGVRGDRRKRSRSSKKYGEEAAT